MIVKLDVEKVYEHMNWDVLFYLMGGWVLERSGGGG